MQTFLGKVAQKVVEDNSDSLEEITIVLPNRRSIVFLKEAFKQHLNHGNWLPEFYSLEDFVQELGQYHQSDQLDLIFELYKTHKKIEGTNAEPFTEFISWGTTLLQDFNEIDRYLVDSKAMFDFISEAKAIEVWNVEGQELSSFQRNYLKFWKSLYPYYLEFSNQIVKQSKVYQGKGFRLVAEEIENLIDHEFGKIYFAGFNALTKAEEKIIDFFVSEQGAEILWDADEYYMEDPHQEAGNFLRNFRKKYQGNFSWLSDHLLTAEKEISIYGISGNIGQAKLVGNLLLEKSEVESKAVVLSDESLLVPVLESLPETIEKVNVTMGYPLSLSSFYSLFESYLRLFQKTSYWKANNAESKRRSFYYKDINSFLSHTAFQLLPSNKEENIKKFLSSIQQEQLLFIDQNQLEPIQQLFDIPLFTINTKIAKSIVSNCIALVQLIRRDVLSSISSLEKEALFNFYQSFNRLKDLVDELQTDLDVETIFQLFQQICSKQSIDFVGEPLGGVQIMGVLESRTLDFEEVIISSVNEGVLPSGKSHNSFIPFDIKRKFGLPVHKEKDSIFSYHFYRLLQRASKISIVYNTKVNQLQGGEMSRFIKQLVFELATKNDKATIRKVTLLPSLIESSESDVRIEQNDHLLLAIKKHVQNGLSPSAINTFLNCELDYYYKYVIGLREQEKVEEKVESNTFGTIVHNTLEKLYQPFLNQLLDERAISDISAKVEPELFDQFKKELGVSPNKGNHKLTYEIAKVFVENLLSYDREQIKSGNKIQLIATEKSFESAFEIQYQGVGNKVSLKGKIDRIDRFNGQLRIIDYKTGGVLQNDLTFQSIDNLLSGRKDKAVQMLVYKMAYEQLNPSEKVEVGIISLKNISRGFLSLKKDINKEDAIWFLEELIAKMYDRERVWKHRVESRYCNFC